MSNMSYCRFRNTLHDLRDCEEALEDMMNQENDDHGEPHHISSPDEREACVGLVVRCYKLVERVLEDAEYDMEALAASEHPELLLENAVKAVLDDAAQRQVDWALEDMKGEE